MIGAMTRRDFGSALQALAALALIGCGGARAFTDADRRAVTAVIDAQRAAWNRGDLDAYMDGYARTPALVFTSGAAIRRGWDETLAKYRARYGADPQTMGTLAFEILDIQPVGADGAVVLGRWRLTGTPVAGAGVFSIVFERRPEGWRIVHDHTSSEPRTP
jgi:ketosteroid isomerase-like protein